MRSQTSDTFFFKRKIGADVVLHVLYLWLRKVRRMEMAGMAETTPKTVAKILTAWYQIMQEDLRSDDVQVGML